VLSPGLFTLQPDESGEQALHMLPAPSTSEQFVLVHGKALRKSDAWTGTALKSAVHYHCTCLNNSFGFEPPEGERAESALELLGDLLGPMPQGFYLTDDRGFPDTGRGNALLPALPIDDAGDAANAADALTYRTAAYGRPVARTVGAAVGVFTNNSITHAPESPIGVVTTVAFDPAARVVQVVCSDLGTPVADPGEGEAFLRDLMDNAVASHSNLGHLVAATERRGVASTLTLAAGSGRLWWTATAVTSEPTFVVPGFTAALTIGIPR
jgi:hypothetical protein